MRDVVSADQFSVVAALGHDELPEDLAAYAKKTAQRKVGRLLDRGFYAAFAAACELHKLKGTEDLDRVALYTVSGWDPSIPVPDFAYEDAPDVVARLSHFYTHPANPSDWLRRMPNNPICNIAITTGFRGPCLHYIGDADALSMITTVAVSSLADGSADSALVVAFDMPDGQNSLLAHEGDARAAGVLLAAGDGTPAGQLAKVAGAASGRPAFDVLQEFVESIRPGVSRG